LWPEAVTLMVPRIVDRCSAIALHQIVPSARADGDDRTGEVADGVVVIDGTMAATGPAASPIVTAGVSPAPLPAAKILTPLSPTVMTPEAALTIVVHAGEDAWLDGPAVSVPLLVTVLEVVDADDHATAAVADDSPGQHVDDEVVGRRRRPESRPDRCRCR
jgi:hypothetical protein